MQHLRDFRGFNYIHHFMHDTQGMHITHVLYVHIIPSVSSVHGVMCVQAVKSGMCVRWMQSYRVSLNQRQQRAYQYQCR